MQIYSIKKERREKEEEKEKKRSKRKEREEGKEKKERNARMLTDNLDNDVLPGAAQQKCPPRRRIFEEFVL